MSAPRSQAGDELGSAVCQAHRRATPSSMAWTHAIQQPSLQARLTEHNCIRLVDARAKVDKAACVQNLAPTTYAAHLPSWLCPTARMLARLGRCRVRQGCALQAPRYF